jgi:hypothetical protein
MRRIDEKGAAVRVPVGPTAKVANQLQVYSWEGCSSMPSFIEQAAEVLCLLALFPMSATSRMAFTALLEHRLYRAYDEGVTP